LDNHSLLLYLNLDREIFIQEFQFANCGFICLLIAFGAIICLLTSLEDLLARLRFEILIFEGKFLKNLEDLEFKDKVDN